MADAGGAVGAGAPVWREAWSAARAAYHRWGAHAKVADLDARGP
jgi:hypothetical protein